MRTSHSSSSLAVLLMLLATAVAPVLAADPGDPVSFEGAISDQKAGSVLIYNLYSSSATNPIAENTRISITNTSTATAVAVHLFFIDGRSCTPADSFICLTRGQTASFLASELDPGTTGFIVAVAVAGSTGCPISFNYLIGDAYLKLASGHTTSLSAVAVAAQGNPGTPSTDGCVAGDTEDILEFSGLPNRYNKLPRVLAAASIPSAHDGDATLLVINNPSGNLATGTNPIGSLFGIFYNDTENPFSFTFTTSACQLKQEISNNFPRTTPRFTTLVPAGRTGWIKLYSPAGAPLLGALINFNSRAGTNPGAFSHGHNLHVLTTTDTAIMRIPVFPLSHC